MKKLLVAGGVLCAMVVVGHVATAQTIQNYFGTWELDKDESSATRKDMLEVSSIRNKMKSRKWR